MAINFQNSKDLDNIRELTREARKAVLEKAEQDYNKRKAREEQSKLRGEDKWMLPGLDAQLKSKTKEKKNKKSKKKKSKKDKKHKKSKKAESNSDTDSEDEWVEKTPEVSTVPLQRDEWMSAPSLLPTFYKNDSINPKRSSMKNDEESARKLLMETPGQTSRELNPYWKNGGTGLPPEKKIKHETEHNEFPTTSKYDKEAESSSRSRNWRKDSKSCTNDEDRGRYSNSSSSSVPGWKKRTDIPKQKSPVRASSSSSESSSEDEKEEESMQTEDDKIWTEQELNSLNARIIKAEIMGNQDLVKSLKRTLASASEQIERRKQEGPSAGKERVIVLTRSDAKGGQHPLPAPRYGEESLQGSKGKGKKTKAETHQSGQRVRYFADDDKYSLKEMFQREKLDTAEDQNMMFSRLAGKKLEKTNEDFDLDDMFESRAHREVDSVAAEARERERAIHQHEKRERVLDSCTSCLDSHAIQKHLIIAIGQKCYLSLPANQSLADGHCFIVPRTHVTCSTQLDEDVWAEIQLFRKALTKMFEVQEADAIFFETAMHLKRFPHMVIECVPLPISAGETAPIYFKKALLDCESEWSMNKKVIDLKGKDVRKGVPKGLPYFFVDFGNQPGFAHVIEDEQRFPPNFAQEILGGILDLEPHYWRRPRRENFDQQKQKVLTFAGMWQQYDFTSKLKHN